MPKSRSSFAKHSRGELTRKHERVRWLCPAARLVWKKIITKGRGRSHYRTGEPKPLALLGTDKNLITWDAVVVSVTVVLSFAAMLWLVIREEVPANQSDMVALVGTLARMASSVVAYWIGSQGSAAM